VTNITVNNGATNLWAESYAYNEAGRRISTTRSNGSDSYQYDDTYQLTGASYGTGSNASSASWSYDASGNRTQAQSISGTNTLGISYSVNEINQYTSVGGASPSYNSRGDLTGINGWSFSYDAFGNLSSAQSGTNAAYHYARDPEGRRAIRQSGSNTILLLNAGDTMLEAYNASNNSATSYIYEPGIDRPLAQVLSNGSIRYVHQDVLGSVVILTDSNGASYQSYSYDAWGKVTARDASGSVIASSAINAPWLFTGRRFDRESGLYHYRARTYSAELGRFLQMDPIKFDAGDPNIYRYVGNDPVNWTDPSGLDIWVGNWGPHQNINVGNPNGNSQGNFSMTFGVNLSNPFSLGNGVQGTIYEDFRNTKPSSTMHMKTTPQQDAQAIQMLKEMEGTTAPYRISNSTCRDFSQDAFQMFKQMFR
jgi:RHS repeat-associated protein